MLESGNLTRNHIASLEEFTDFWNHWAFELLLDKAGLDPFIRTQKNETLLHIAASLGHKDFIEILIKKCKIKYDVEDVGKKTALDR